VKKPTAPPPKPANKSGGAKSAPALVSYEVKYRFAPEEAEAKAVEVVPSDIQAGLASAQWKERLESAEKLLAWVESGEGATAESEILFRYLGKVPGWNEKNFQVSSKVFAVMTALAQKSPTAQVIGPLTDKLGDMKLKKPAGEALITFAEKTSLGFVLSQGEPAVPTLANFNQHRDR
jgi:cytoskeleton-associated protein 5